MSADVGVPGVTVEDGKHICGFYREREERNAIVLHFLETALARGESCVAAVDDGGEPALERLAQRYGELLTLLTPEDAYIPDGEFDLQRAIASWDRIVADLCAANDDAPLRAVDDHTWLSKLPPDSPDFLTFESLLNGFLPRSRATGLCLYDVDSFDSDVIVSVLRTHPRVLMRGSVIDNAFCVPPEQDADAGPSRRSR
ncbi:MAG: MEDS domain-containing protein [Actinomycetota bacterium]|nr:MEDS domain-containing protein [Actinomycetota bacterium]